MTVLRGELERAIAARAAGEAVAPHLDALARVAEGGSLSEDEAKALFETAPVDVLPQLFRATTGDRGAIVLALVATESLAEEREGMLYALATRTGEPVPRKVVAHLRRSIHRVASVPAMVSMSFAALEIDTPATKAAQKTLGSWIIPEDIKRFRNDLDAALSRPLVDSLPERDEEVLITGFTARRAAEKVGRNDPCPCGSGKKYKKCCEGKDDARAKDLSPVAGLTRAEWLASGAVDAGAVSRLSPDELSSLPLAKLSADAVVEAARRAAGFRRWPLVEAAWPHVLDKADDKTILGARDTILLECALAGEVDLADRLLATFPGDLPYDLEVSLALAHQKNVGSLWVDLERDVEGLLRDGKPEALQDVAYAVLDQFPALGVLVARGALSPRAREASETLLYAIEDARAMLDLPDGDPGWKMLARQEERVSAEDRAVAKRRAAEERDRDQEAAVRESARLARERAEELEARLRDAERALAAAPRAQADQAPSAEDAEHARRLAAKVAELKGLVAEGVKERADLRARLSDIEHRAAREEPGEPVSEPASEPDDEQQGDGLSAPRGLSIPHFSDDAQKQLHKHPRHVAEDALHRAAELGSGEGWSGVKQMQDIEPPLYSARLGIHHRMLFRVSDGRLAVLEVLQREGLDAALKRYRR